MKIKAYVAPIVFLGVGLIFSHCKSNTNKGNDEVIPEVEVSASTLLQNLAGNVTVESPISHKNLDIFFISGETQGDNLEYVPLNRAMKDEQVRISETSNVNELEISSLSDKTIFVHAGDIVKGGKQDRTLTYDLLVSAETKEMKLSSFCVESDRWSPRGSEESEYFSENTKMLSSRDLKISSKKNKRQSDVWREVEETQDKLSNNISEYYDAPVDVKANQSASSLELALDNKELKKMKKEYKAAFEQVNLDGFIGFAYAINGELYNIDIYNNKALFKELYDKLLTAAIVEAIAELDVKAKAYEHLSIDTLLTKLNLQEDVDESSQNLNKRTKWSTQEDSALVVFTSIDRENKDIWVHHNVIVKDESAPVNRNDYIPDYQNEALEAI